MPPPSRVPLLPRPTAGPGPERVTAAGPRTASDTDHCFAIILTPILTPILTMALAKGARMRGVRIVEGVRGRVPMRMDLRLRFDDFSRATRSGSHVYIGILGRSGDMRALEDFAWRFNQDTPGQPTLWSEPGS